MILRNLSVALLCVVVSLQSIAMYQGEGSPCVLALRNATRVKANGGKLPLCDFEKSVKGKWAARQTLPPLWAKCTNATSCAASHPWYSRLGGLKVRWEAYAQWVNKFGMPQFVPEQCAMKHPSAGDLVRLLRHRKLVLIGDSVGEEHYRSLLLFVDEYIRGVPDEMRYTQTEVPGVSTARRDAFESGDGANCMVVGGKREYFVLCFIGVRAGRPRVLHPAAAYRFAADKLSLTPDDIVLLSPGLHYNPLMSIHSFSSIIADVLVAIKANPSPPLTLFREVSPQLFRDGRYNPENERSKSTCCVKPPMSALEWEGRSSYDWANPDLEDALRGEVPMLKIFAATMAANGTDMKKGRCQEPGEEPMICSKVGCHNQDCLTQDGTHFLSSGHTYEFWTEVLYNVLEKRLRPIAGTPRDMHSEAASMVENLLAVNHYTTDGMRIVQPYTVGGPGGFVYKRVRKVRKRKK